jgi:hypothetical protein
MQKSYRFDELGDKECLDCGKKLKKRLEQEKPTVTLCYRCYKGLPPKKEEEVIAIKT